MAAPSTDAMTSLVDKFYKTHFVQDEEHVVDSDNHSDCSDESDAHSMSDEAGLMDYRYNEIDAQEKDSTIVISVTFRFTSTAEEDDAPLDFEEKWCLKFDPKEIAQDALGEEYDLLDAFWEGSKLHMIINNLDNSYDADEVASNLLDNSLEDGPFEACPGESFWVVSYKNLEDAR
jgi:hypothetical protein